MLNLLKAVLVGALMGLTACGEMGGSAEMADANLAAGTNRAFTHTVTTTASADAIWRLWTDVTTWKDWDRGLKDAEMTGPMKLGATGRIIPLSGPASTFQITEFVDGEHYAFETRMPLARLTVRRTLISRDPVTFRHDVSFDGLGAGFWAGRFGPGFRAALPPTMAALSAQAEAADATQ